MAKVHPIWFRCMRLSYRTLSTILIIKFSRVVIFSATEVSYPFHEGLLCIYLCLHPDHFSRPSYARLLLSFRASLLVVCFTLKLFVAYTRPNPMVRVSFHAEPLRLVFSTFLT